MGNRSKFLVAGSMIIGALFWTASRVVGRGGEVVAAGHLRGRAGSFMTDADAAAVDDKASSSRIHPHTQPFVSYFKDLRLLLCLLFRHEMVKYYAHEHTHTRLHPSPSISFDRTCCNCVNNETVE